MTDEASNKEAPQAATDAGRWKLLSALLLGVLIPIIASAVPWILDKWVPAHRLGYSVTGPITGEEAFAFSVQVVNDGREAQKSVEVSLPIRVTPSIDFVNRPDGTIDMKEKKPSLIFDAVPKPTKQRSEGEVTVLFYDKLRPSEQIDINVFAIGKGAFISEYDLEKLRIVSDDTVARSIEPSEEAQFLYRVGAYLFLLFIGGLLVFGIYYELFMPVAKKRADLQKQLDKLKG